MITLSGAQATRANIQAKLGDLAKQTKADDHLVLMLIGHGSFDEVDYKFNIPGPDITATELASLLDKIPAQQAVVDMTSASGGALPALQKPKRIVITATKSGTEKNATVFPRYFIEGLRDPAADADKNEVITVLEAFRYAEAKTAKFYDELKRLSTEHPLIEDAGKGEGVKAPTAENGEGLLAGRFALLHTGSAVAMAKDPEKQKLLKQKEDIEDEDRRAEISQSIDAGGGIPPASWRSFWWTWRRLRRRSTNDAPLHPSIAACSPQRAPAIGAGSRHARRSLAMRSSAPQRRSRRPRLLPAADALLRPGRSQAEGFWGMGDFQIRQRCLPRRRQASR